MFCLAVRDVADFSRRLLEAGARVKTAENAEEFLSQL
jgi:hypothetical protein